MRCIFEGCETPTDWTYGTSPLCTEHCNLIRPLPWDLRAVICDAATMILETSFALIRQQQSAADRAYHREKRKLSDERKALRA